MAEEVLYNNRDEFRQWLLQNCSSQDGIWMVFGKEGKLQIVKPDETLEEALCFGWIDGQFKSIDSERYLKKFTPRRKGSKWSERNRKIVGKLVNKGLMTQWGLDAIERSKKEGTWDAPSGPGISEDQIDAFAQKLEGFPKAHENFMKFPPSARKQSTGFFCEPKKEETFKKRLENVVALLEQNKRPM